MPILIAVDGSDQAKAVVSGVGSRLGVEDGQVPLMTVLDASELHGVLEHAPRAAVERWGSIEVHELVGAREPPARVIEYKSQAVDHAVAEAQSTLRRLQQLLPALQCEVRVAVAENAVAENAATAILDAAEKIGADVIAVGAHGRTGVRRALMGSTAESVIRPSPRPVPVGCDGA